MDMTEEEAMDLVKCYSLHRSLDEAQLTTVVELMRMAYEAGFAKGEEAGCD